MGATIFGLAPHLRAIAMEKLLEHSGSALDLLNNLSLIVALVAVLVGMIAALLLIFGVAQATEPLQVSITLFAGASATMCSLKFFLNNRDQA